MWVRWLRCSMSAKISTATGRWSSMRSRRATTSGVYPQLLSVCHRPDHEPLSVLGGTTGGRRPLRRQSGESPEEDRRDSRACRQRFRGRHVLPRLKNSSTPIATPTDRRVSLTASRGGAVGAGHPRDADRPGARRRRATYDQMSDNQAWLLFPNYFMRSGRGVPRLHLRAAPRRRPQPMHLARPQLYVPAAGAPRRVPGRADRGR